MSIVAAPASLPGPAGSDFDALRELHFRELQRQMSGGALAPDPPPPASEPDISFRDILSVINPLQHLPIIGNVYRAITGDVISPVARAIGGGLFGGPIGFITAVANAVIEDISGRDVGAHLLAMVGVGTDNAGGGAQLAATSPPANLLATPAATLAARPVDGAVAAAPPAPHKAKPPAAPPKPAAETNLALALPATPNPPRGASTQGRDLAAYWAYAGTKGPLPSATGQRPTTTAQAIRPPAAHALAALQRPVVEAASKPAAAAGDPSAAAPQAPEGPPAQWFAAAMARGLDRYQATTRLQRSPAAIGLLQ